jgi:tRNA(fMet)-specific endonuclease VapC
VPNRVLPHEYGVARQPSRRAAAAAELLDRMECLPFTIPHAIEAGLVRAELEAIGRPARALDHLIAGVARSENLILMTRNVKHFKDVSQLAVASW